MTNPDDLKADPFANAQLTPEQRAAWLRTCSDLNLMRSQVRDLQNKIKDLERQPVEEEPLVLTRPEFNREVARMLAFDERYGGTSSVLYFDFENMDDITARHGKAVANAAVREFSSLLVKHVRGSDIIGRLASDEFGVLLVRCANPDAWRKAKELAEKLSVGLTTIHGCAIEPDISYGAYTFQSEEDVATGLKQASQVLTKSSPKQ